MAVACQCYSQDISHQVLAPMTRVADISYYNVSQTVGESIVEGLDASNFYLTQGFNQPSIHVVSSKPSEGSGVEVYPNPAVDILNVELFGFERTDFELVIFGFNGALFHKQEISCGREHWNIESIDISNYKRGLYFVRVRSFDNRISRLFKIEKM
ncbi:MAG: T9SS type A sorting domain-containing protein [Bacteroidota bacterium]|nr:T9SS type A sorting domain-containing protein [Bacteroidota bacterium]